MPETLDPMPSPSPRALAEARAQALALYLKVTLKELGTEATTVSRALGRGPQYLSQVFAGRSALKLKDLFGALGHLDRHPEDFFTRAYPAPAAPPAKKAATRPMAKVEQMGARLLRSPYRRTPKQSTDRAGQVLAAWIVGAGMKQRPISRKLGLGAESLAKALRNETDLTAWHVLGVLAEIGQEPGLFFEEVVASDEPHGLTDEGARLLARVLEDALATLKARAEEGPAEVAPKPKKPAPHPAKKTNGKKKR